MATFYFVRHGETEMNKAHIFQGFVDSPLTEKGVQESRNLGLILRERTQFDKVYCSPLERVKTTCDLILEAYENDHEIIYDDRLKEFNFGVLEGTYIDESKSKHPQTLYDLYENPASFVPIVGGESIYNFIGRVADFYLELQRLAKQGDAENVLVVSHGGVVSAFLYLIESKHINDFWLPVPPSSVTIVNQSNKDNYEVVETYLRKEIQT